jgi:hypothetical protein
VVAISNYDHITVFRNQGGGVFAETTQSASMPQTLAVGNFDNEGTPDFAIGTGAGQIVVVTKFFGQRVVDNYDVGSNGVQQLVTSDLDGDLDIDIAAVTYDPKLVVLFNDGSGKFTITSQAVPFNPDGVAAADFNGDTLRDIAVGETGQFNGSAAGGDVYIHYGSAD